MSEGCANKKTPITRGNRLSSIGGFYEHCDDMMIDIFMQNFCQDTIKKFSRQKMIMIGKNVAFLLFF